MPIPAWKMDKYRLVERYREENLTAEKGQIVFAGSSLMEMFPVHEWAAGLGPDAPRVYNRGVGGWRTEDMLATLDAQVTGLAPRRLFINIDAAANEGMRQTLRIRTNERIRQANAAVADLARRRGYRYRDFNAPLTDAQGRLKAEYTTEGMHITPEGYRAIWPLVAQAILEA